VGLPGPTSTDSTAKPVGSSASPKDRLPAALEGTAIGQLPLPRDVAVISVEPRRVVVIVSTATETPRIVKSENSP
jgi:hypothetical protein